MARDTHLYFPGAYIPRYCVEDLIITDDTDMRNTCEASSASIFNREPQLRKHVTLLRHEEFGMPVVVFEPVDEVFAKVQAFLNQPE